MHINKVDQYLKYNKINFSLRFELKHINVFSLVILKMHDNLKIIFCRLTPTAFENFATTRLNNHHTVAIFILHFCYILYYLGKLVLAVCR